MGPVRGFKKKRKPEKKHDKNGSAASGSPEREGPVDWWDDLSKRMNDSCINMLFLCDFCVKLEYISFIICTEFISISVMTKFTIWQMLTSALKALVKE
ncbi:nuclease HARBI [Spatholobus suberectus]|nr:nuclease HARBI [Spatholobus suberectus]